MNSGFTCVGTLLNWDLLGYYYCPGCNNKLPTNCSNIHCSCGCYFQKTKESQEKIHRQEFKRLDPIVSNLYANWLIALKDFHNIYYDEKPHKFNKDYRLKMATLAIEEAREIYAIRWREWAEHENYFLHMAMGAL